MDEPKISRDIHLPSHGGGIPTAMPHGIKSLPP
jgi:hypothetical protein